MAYINPQLREYFEDLPIDLQETLLHSTANIGTVGELETALHLLGHYERCYGDD